MKIVRRNGVFETNSSSTHAVTLCTKKPNEAWRDEKDIPSEEREVRSAQEKLVLVFGFIELIRQEMKCWDMDIFDSVEEGEARIKELNSFFERAKSILIRVCCEVSGIGEDEIRALLHKAKEWSGSAPICNRFFNEDVLDTCTCHFCYMDAVMNLLGGELATKSQIEEAARRLFDENVYFLIKEEWFGGIWTLEQSIF
ncbi:MAG: hypothetical protein J6R42_04770 [Clostridia bacterium]|nr:hypothetical protein [Clostridia bacterium]